ncbi:MAG: carbohydrate-binding family 9-like protein [Desulfamplus sp.]|nr:carbohydrate-binding family 9-like protein [Desulfamplus sp.]
MECKVSRQISLLIIDANWDSFPWIDIPSELLQNYMGNKPDHFPKTEVKIAYDDTAIHLIFRVEDRYVRAATEEHQGNVWEDSCVEFFFTPDSDLSVGYFNLEMNCGGTMLFHFHPEAGKERIVIPKSECSQIVCNHSLPQIVDPEILEPVTWTVAYSIPIDLLKKYCCQVITPAPDVEWKANFYKCADKTSHPHWLTWSPVNFPKPNFHIPESFGILKFA